MALKIWLPLNGNTNNLGIDGDVKVAGTIGYSEGKMGKALYASASSSANGIMAPKQEKAIFTVCMWFKSFEHTGAARVLFNEGRDYNTFGIRVHLSKDTDTCNMSTKSSSYSFTFTPDTWYHIAFSRDGQKAYYYVNGELVKTANDAANPDYSESSGYVNIARFGHAGGYLYGYTGYLNDFRYYDECLSDKQIKEISKGLTAHYTMSGVGAKNFIQGSSLYSSSLPTGGCILAYCNGVTSYTHDSTEHAAHLITPDSTNQYSNANNGIGYAYHTAISDLGVTYGETITFSCDVKGNGYTDGGIPYIAIRENHSSSGTWYGTGALSTSVKFIPKQDEWTRISVTRTLAAKGDSDDALKLWFCLHMNFQGNIYIKNLKVEKSTKLTSWIPHNSDAEYMSQGYGTDGFKDVSGYGHNGTIGGTMNYFANTPKYTTATSFGNGWMYGLKTPITSSADVFTYSIWYYPTLISNAALYNCRTAAGNGFSLFALSDGGLRFDTGSEYQWTVPNCLTLYQWHHIVVTYDKINGKKMYINGVLKSSTAIPGNLDTVNTAASIGISSNGYNPSGNIVYGALSDARIYSTVLSDDDVLELYKTSGIIDDKGNVFAYEFVEEE